MARVNLLTRALAALEDDGGGPVRHPDELNDLRHRPDGVQVGPLRLLDFVGLLREYEDGRVALAEGLVDGLDRAGAPGGDGDDDAGEEHGVFDGEHGERRGEVVLRERLLVLLVDGHQGDDLFIWIRQIGGGLVGGRRR